MTEVEIYVGPLIEPAAASTQIVSLSFIFSFQIFDCAIANGIDLIEMKQNAE